MVPFDWRHGHAVQNGARHSNIGASAVVMAQVLHHMVFAVLARTTQCPSVPLVVRRPNCDVPIFSMRVVNADHVAVHVVPLVVVASRPNRALKRTPKGAA